MIAIEVRGLWKKYRRYSQHRPNSLQEVFLRGFRWLKPADVLWALSDVSFDIPEGSMAALVGANGAGKSTLLRLVGRVGRPDRGSIRTHGRIAALIDLGTGFHPDLTGRENIFINGIINGLTRKEVEARFDEIVNFAELEPFIDSPLRTYSTGMQMWLGFAVATSIKPEILLIDEILAVGDEAFQNKCLDRIQHFKTSGSTILLVTHDAELVKRICDQAIWLKAGHLTEMGPAALITKNYQEDIHHETRQRTPVSAGSRFTSGGVELRLHENRFGSLEAEITDVQVVYGNDGQMSGTFLSGGELKMHVEADAHMALPSPIFGVTLSRSDGLICYDTSSEQMGRLPDLQKGKFSLDLSFRRLDLVGGQYYLDVGLYTSDWSYAYDYHYHVYPLQVAATPGEKGIVRLPVKLDFNPQK